MSNPNDTQTIDAAALRARLAEMAQRARDEMGAVADEDSRAEIARLRALLEVAQTSLAAATSGRRVTVVDEIERLQRERDALRDAAREYLDARHRGLVALLAHLDADPADAAARDAVSADEARVTAARTRLAALVGGAR